MTIKACLAEFGFSTVDCHVTGIQRNSHGSKPLVMFLFVGAECQNITHVDDYTWATSQDLLDFMLEHLRPAGQSKWKMAEAEVPQGRCYNKSTVAIWRYLQWGVTSLVVDL